MQNNSPSLEARVIILNYNGKELLPKCLPSIVEAAKKSSHKVTITVLDNQSTDDGLNYVRENYPDVHIEVSPENKILCSYNDFALKAQEPVLIFLNNDIRVDKNFIDPMLARFQDNPSTFLVAPKVMSFDGNTVEAAKTVAKMRWGLFWSTARYPGYLSESDIPSETFSSGFGAFSRDKFVSLGGYDPRYLPGIMEDADLCLRAQRKGYQLYYEPTSIVYHIGQASFKKRFGSHGISVLAHRNNFLFMWKNFKGFSFWVSHIFFLPLRILLSLIKGDSSLITGFFKALRHSRCL